MKYSRWATKEELKERLVAIDYNSNIKKSGLGMMYDENKLYIKDDVAHSIIIGSTGSGKTQTCLLPQLRLAIKANESFVLHDVKGEIYDILSGELKKQNYNTVVINLSNPVRSDRFNLFTLPYKLYKNSDIDKALEIIENSGNYICQESKISPNNDPFWTNSARSLFVGLTLYLFETLNKDEVNLSSMVKVLSDIDKVEDYINSLEKTDLIYIYLSSILLAPPETKASIISVLKQKIMILVTRESLLKMMSSSSFEIENIQKEKTAIFIINENKSYSKILLPLIIQQCFDAVMITNYKERRLNILIDEFEYLEPINDFKTILALSRGNNIRFSIFVKSLLELNNVYGPEVDFIKMSFGNIVYLLANDMETLKEISGMCGMTEVDGKIEQLISPEELKLLNPFEAVILIPRSYPIKTKLLPDYQIKWNFDNTKIELPELK